MWRYLGLGMTAGAVVLFGGADRALAAGVSVTSSSRLVFVASPGEPNAVTIDGAGTGVMVSDAGAPLTVGAGCVANGPNQATCSPVVRITASLGDADDQFRNNTSLPSNVGGSAGNDVIHGGTGDDSLRGEAGIDQIYGYEGNDTINTRGGLADLADCGPGIDTLIYDALDHVADSCETSAAETPPPPAPGGAPPPASGSRPVPLVLPASPGTPDPPGFALPSGACPARFLGTEQDDRIDGTGGGERMFGMDGDDVLNSLGGDDCLFGMDGTDSLYAGDGSDLLRGGGSGDLLSASSGGDRLWGENGNDRMSGGSGADRLYGSAGRDVLFGGLDNDRLLGGPGPDRLLGGKGDDRLKGGLGKDTYRGGAGRDTIRARNGAASTVDCGPGRDIARVDAADVVRRCERVTGR